MATRSGALSSRWQVREALSGVVDIAARNRFVLKASSASVLKEWGIDFSYLLNNRRIPVNNPKEFF
jgi:hypothetical protein